MKNKNIYTYDGTFNGLLSLVKYLFFNKIIPYNIKSNNYNSNLFETMINLNIPSKESDLAEIQKKVGSKIFSTIYYIFLSNYEFKELIIFYFLASSFKYQEKVFFMRNLKWISKGLELAKYVSRENHKMKGFIRFKELNNKVLYAEFAPENNIIFLLSKHFKNRLKNEYWVIKDIKRNIISMYDKNNFYLVENSNLIINAISESEKDIETMWKDFYQTIGIKERKNDKCRINFMPKKYWHYITEVQDEESSYAK